MADDKDEEGKKTRERSRRVFFLLARTNDRPRLPFLTGGVTGFYRGSHRRAGGGQKECISRGLKKNGKEGAPFGQDTLVTDARACPRTPSARVNFLSFLWPSGRLWPSIRPGVGVMAGCCRRRPGRLIGSPCSGWRCIQKRGRVWTGRRRPENKSPALGLIEDRLRDL